MFHHFENRKTQPLPGVFLYALGRLASFFLEETLTVHLRGEDVHVKPHYEVNQPPWILAHKDGRLALIIEPRKKNRPYFPLNPGCLIGILIMTYKNPYITV